MKQFDAQTVAEIVNTHGAALVMVARQWCRNPDDAVQEALIDLVRLDPKPNDVAAWLHTAVRRRAMNSSRAASRRENHHRRAGMERDSWFLPQDDSEEQIDYQLHLDRLPPLEREIVVARIWEQLTFSQISAVVGHPVSSVHRHYRRALADLARMINEHEFVRKTDGSRSSQT